jgi:hypothetical protein
MKVFIIYYQDAISSRVVLASDGDGAARLIYRCAVTSSIKRRVCLPASAQAPAGRLKYVVITMFRLLPAHGMIPASPWRSDQERPGAGLEIAD